jgi:uncharacterized protein YfaQ (DUF2300 family)
LSFSITICKAKWKVSDTSEYFDIVKIRAIVVVIIAYLLLGIKFQGLKEAGDPATQSAKYEKDGADELVMLDVSATPQGRRTCACVVVGLQIFTFLHSSRNDPSHSWTTGNSSNCWYVSR